MGMYWNGIHISGNFNKMEKICGIYKIVSPSGKIYIGQSIDIKRRWEKEYKKLKCYGSPKLYCSLVKYGVENHIFEILKTCCPSELNNMEKYYVDLFKTFNTTHGLNLKDGGGSNGITSIETKQKQSVSHKLISDETRLKMRLAKLKNPSKYWAGRKRDEATKEKIRKKVIGNKNTKGFKHSETFKENCRKRMTGKKLSEATKLKMKATDNKGRYFIGHKPLQATIDKIRLAHLGKDVSEATREKMKLKCGDKNGFFGKNHTNEARQKMRETKLKNKQLYGLL